MGLLNELNQLPSVDDVSVIGDAAIESEIVLTALREECATEAEYADLINASAIEMSLYGVIDDADAAMEAAKKIVIKDYKSAKFNRIQRRTAIRLAMKSNDALYKKYRKYRDLFLESRNAIYQKYGAKAKSESRKIIQNAKRKSANIESKTGKSITEKMDAQIKKNSGSNKK